MNMGNQKERLEDMHEAIKIWTVFKEHSLQGNGGVHNGMKQAVKGITCFLKTGSNDV